MAMFSLGCTSRTCATLQTPAPYTFDSDRSCETNVYEGHKSDHTTLKHKDEKDSIAAMRMNQQSE